MDKETKKGKGEQKFAAAAADAIIKGLADGIMIVGLDGEIVNVNPACAKMLGYDAKELIGKNVAELPTYTKPEDIEKAMALMKEIIEKGSAKPIEMMSGTKDGREFPCSFTASLIKDADGNPQNLVAIIRDITELKRAEDEIVATKDYADNIIKSMIDTLIVVSPEGKIKTINRATMEMLGYKEDELIGKPVATIFAEEEEEVSIFKGTRLKKLIEEGAVRDYDMKYRTKKGEVIPVSFSGSVMRDKDRNLVGIVGIARDMREIKRLMQKEKELAEAKAAAASASEKKRADELQKLYEEMQHTREELESSYTELQNSKDELVRSEKLAFTGRISASIAHEIRNPLTNVSMAVQEVKKVLNPREQGSKHIEIVERNIERINFLITELLNSARPVKLNLQAHNIHKLLKEVLKSNKTKINLQRIKVIKNFTPQASILKIDQEQMQRAFANLINNAIEAMPKSGTLTILTELNGNYFLVKIKDTGKGIPDRNVIRIFDPFFSTKPGGVGLGLTICYGIIVSHGGTIEVESKQKKGSIFTVSLPIEQKVKRER